MGMLAPRSARWPVLFLFIHPAGRRSYWPILALKDTRNRRCAQQAGPTPAYDLEAHPLTHKVNKPTPYPLPLPLCKKSDRTPPRAPSAVTREAPLRGDGNRNSDSSHAARNTQWQSRIEEHLPVRLIAPQMAVQAGRSRYHENNQPGILD